MSTTRPSAKDLELFRAVEGIDAVYVPVGLGSGICGMIAARDALGLSTEIVGVVADQAPAYAMSFAQGEMISTPTADTFADGMSGRVPHPEAMAAIWKGVGRIVTVSEREIAEAVRVYVADTHNLSEGAGAASLAALLKDRDRVAGRRVAVVLSGGNLDASRLAEILAGSVPAP
ncbi:MAG: pyridoxal-phosphate dependent enzyme [Acidobacteriota bacterium]